MKQLSGADAAFLNMETPTVFGHVSTLLIYDRPDPGFVPVEAVYTRYAALVSHIEPLHRRLVEVPFELDLPYWIVDPDLDLDFHIRELNLPNPGRVDQLADQVARIVGRPMDRTRPLWEVYVIDGLEDDQWALLTRYHHAAIDGAAGARLLTMLHDTSPEPAPLPEPRRLPTEQVPDGVELLRTALTNLHLNPYRAMQTQVHIAQRIAEAFGANWTAAQPNEIEQREQPSAAREAQQAVGPAPPTSAPPTPRNAPPTPWNKAITAHRRLALRSTSLENIKRLKHATDTTVNDIVLAVCAGALRRYLLVHDALPEAPLRAMVPVSIRTGNEADPWTNRVSAIYADLPTDTDDPSERIARCHAAMRAAKDQFKMVPADALADLSRYSAPVLAASAMRLASQLRLADQYPQPVNVIISNVPGPRQPLYFAGGRLQHQFPVSIVTDGQGLNVTVQSYLDKLDFGFVADRDLVPDLWDLADMHIDEIAILFEATGAEWATPPDVPPERRGPLSHLQSRTEKVTRPGAPQASRAPRSAFPASSKKAAPAKEAATTAAPPTMQGAATKELGGTERASIAAEASARNRRSSQSKKPTES